MKKLFTPQVVASLMITAVLLASGIATAQTYSWKAVGTTTLTGLTDVSTTMTPTEGQSLVWDNSASEWKASTIVTVPNATKSMVAGWPDVIKCNVTNPNWGIDLFYKVHSPYAADSLYYYRHNTAGATNYELLFNADGTFNGYNGITTTDCNKTIAQLYAAGQAFDLVGGDTTTLSTLTDVSVTGTPADGEIMQFNGTSSKWETTSASSVGTTVLTGLTDVSTTMTPTEGQSLVWDNAASEWKASTIVTVPNATKSMTAGWPDVISCNVTNPVWGPDSKFYQAKSPHISGLYWYRYIYSGLSYDVYFNADGTFNSYENITASNCNTTIAALYAAGQAFDLVGGDTTTLSTLTDVSITGTPTGGSAMIFNSSSSKWEVSQGLYEDATGKVGIGTTTPATKLDIIGTLKIADGGEACSATVEGSQRYNSVSKIMEFCNGTVWAGVGGDSIVASSIATNGYARFGNGLIFQWGSYESIGDTQQAFSFPIAFPNAALSVQVTLVSDGSAYPINLGLTSPTKSIFYINRNDAMTGTKPIRMFAVGY